MQTKHFKPLSLKNGTNIYLISLPYKTENSSLIKMMKNRYEVSLPAFLFVTLSTNKKIYNLKKFNNLMTTIKIGNHLK